MGPNTTLTVQEPRTGIEPVQPLLLAGTVNAALFDAIELIVSGALPQFDTCMLCDAEVLFRHSMPVDVAGSISET